MPGQSDLCQVGSGN